MGENNSELPPNQALKSALGRAINNFELSMKKKETEWFDKPEPIQNPTQSSTTDTEIPTELPNSK